jgi:Ca2+-binding RTX toxin-like protein
MKALLAALIALGLVSPATASADMGATLIGGELRIVGDDGRDTPLMTVEDDDGDPFFMVPGPVTASGPGACDGENCWVRAVRRIVLELRGGDDAQFGVDAAGRPTEWFGGPGNDQLWGTDSDDVIHGEAGLDSLSDENNSRVANDDVLDGGPGADSIDTSFGNDRLAGGPGNDTIHASTGRDLVDAGPGNDRIWIFFGNHRIDAGRGNDYVRGGAGNDVIDCGPGRDTVNVRWGGRDRIRNCERRTRELR